MRWKDADFSEFNSPQRIFSFLPMRSVAGDSPLQRVSREVQIPAPEGTRIRKVTLGIAGICALFLAGYFCALYKGRSGLSALTSNGDGQSSAPVQADNSLPVAPPFETNSAPGDLLARAKLENELLYTELQSFVCSEQMQRYQGHLDGANPHRIDTVNTQVSFENGIESYTDIHQDSHVRASLSSIPGAWSEGEFGTLLRQTRALLATQPLSLQATGDLDGVQAAVYSFEISGNDSPWELAVGSQQYRVPFRTQVWVSKSSGQIMKIERASTAMPPDTGISEIQWSVVLKPVELNEKTWLLPKTGEYSVLYARANHREWNLINFSDYHRYASRSVIHF